MRIIEAVQAERTIHVGTHRDGSLELSHLLGRQAVVGRELHDLVHQWALRARCSTRGEEDVLQVLDATLLIVGEVWWEEMCDYEVQNRVSELPARARARGTKGSLRLGSWLAFGCCCC